MHRTHEQHNQGTQSPGCLFLQFLPCSTTQPLLTQSSFVISAPRRSGLKTTPLFSLYIMSRVFIPESTLCFHTNLDRRIPNLVLDIPRVVYTSKSTPNQDGVMTVNERMTDCLVNRICDSFHQGSGMTVDESMEK